MVMCEIFLLRCWSSSKNKRIVNTKISEVIVGMVRLNWENNLWTRGNTAVKCNGFTSDVKSLFSCNLEHWLLCKTVKNPDVLKFKGFVSCNEGANRNPWNDFTCTKFHVDVNSNHSFQPNMKGQVLEVLVTIISSKKAVYGVTWIGKALKRLPWK